MDSPQITIVLLVSRDFLLDKLFERLNEMIVPKDTNLLVIVDGLGKLYIKARNLAQRSKYQSLCIHAFLTPTPLRGQGQRRKRIADMHNIAQEHIQTDYVFMLEDDGIPPKDTLQKLIKLHEKYPEAGFVSGAEVGRWLSPYIGGWVFSPIDEPTSLESVMPGGVQEVTSAGFYACLTKHYKRYTFASSPFWGPDVQWGLNLAQDGFKNYMDTDLVIDHYSGDKIINLETKQPKKVRLHYKNGAWRSVLSVAKAV